MKRATLLTIVLAVFIVSSAFTPQDDKLKASMESGKGVYAGVCLACHMQNGEGITGVFPPLAKSDYLMKDVDRNIKSLIEGLSGEITVNGSTYNQVMPASGLDDQDIADVLNYVMNSWGNKADEMISKKQVAKVRASLK
jgi:nitrite reductase (NO-forming)